MALWGLDSVVIIRIIHNLRSPAMAGFSFEYRLEAGSPDTWGGIFSTNRWYPLNSYLYWLNNVTVEKQFSSWVINEDDK